MRLNTRLCTLYLLGSLVLSCDAANEGCIPACSVGYTCQAGACVAEAAGGKPLSLLDDLDGHAYGTGDVIAQGAHGTLRRSSADAFVQALAFVLTYLSDEPIAFSATEHEQIIGVMAQNYSSVDKDTQIVVARFDEIWAEVSPQWQSLSQDDRIAFCYIVLVVAFGRESVEAWIAETGGSGEGGGACDYATDPSSCVAAACGTADCWEAYHDTNNSLSCWASAGCADYDSSNDTYTYEEYNTDTGSYDYYDYSAD